MNRDRDMHCPECASLLDWNQDPVDPTYLCERCGELYGEDELVIGTELERPLEAARLAAAIKEGLGVD